MLDNKLLQSTKPDNLSRNSVNKNKMGLFRY